MPSPGLDELRAKPAFLELFGAKDKKPRRRVTRCAAFLVIIDHYSPACAIFPTRRGVNCSLLLTQLLTASQPSPLRRKSLLFTSRAQRRCSAKMLRH